MNMLPSSGTVRPHFETLARVAFLLFIATVTPTCVGEGVVAGCEAPVQAFCVEYFGGRTLAGAPLLTATEAAVQHNWQMGSPGPGVPIDNFSARWRGRFTFDGTPVSFKVLADDGVRLKLDGVTVIDGWKDQAATEYRRELAPAAGEHLLEIEYYEYGGQARMEASWEPVRACDLPVGQFCAEYFNNRNLTGNPRLTVYEPDLSHNWGTAGPAAGIPADNFSVRWKGEFDFVPGPYSFGATADDGIRVWLDDEVIVDAWSGSFGTRIERLRWLTGRHRVMVEYFDAAGPAFLTAGWSPVRSVPNASPAPIGSNANSTVGTNLGAWRGWSTEQPFLNVFKVSRAWIPQAKGVWDTGEQASIDVDADGWVRSLPAADSPLRFRSVTTMMLDGTDLNGVRQGGDYVVLYDGEGRLEYSLGARKVAAASRPNRDVINVDSQHSGGIQISITATDPNGTGNYIRNIRVVPVGKVCDDDLLAYCHTETDPACGRAACRSVEAAVGDRLFHPAFLRTLVYYKSLRFMDPMSTNVLSGNQPQIVDWAQRATPAKARWSDQAGIPVEVAVALSNQVQADPWLNMPHRASDDYVRQFARLAKSTLDPARRVYVEYGNEIWNTAFSAGTWVEQQALAAWPASPDSPFTKRINWYGKRSAEICDIWKREWAEDAGRVICVLGAQAANNWTARAALDCRLWERAPCQGHGIDAIAIAPYFGQYLGTSSRESTLNGWVQDPDGGLNPLFQELEYGQMVPGGPVGGALAEIGQWVAGYADLARQRGLQLLAYEGGQHLVGVGNVVNNAGITRLFNAANRDPRMGQMYLDLLHNWRQAGGGLFMHYVSTAQYGRYGSWGALENQNQTSTPKFDALKSFILE